jgi:hypothetical protein
MSHTSFYGTFPFVFAGGKKMCRQFEKFFRHRGDGLPREVRIGSLIRVYQLVGVQVHSTIG